MTKFVWLLCRYDYFCCCCCCCCDNHLWSKQQNWRVPLVPFDPIDDPWVTMCTWSSRGATTTTTAYAPPRRGLLLLLLWLLSLSWVEVATRTHVLYVVQSRQSISKRRYHPLLSYSNWKWDSAHSTTSTWLHPKQWREGRLDWP